MSIWEIVLIGVGLSMDAFAVALSDGIAYRAFKRKLLAVPLFFGLFQAVMPVIGFFIGSVFAGYIGDYADYAVLAILGIIGIKMVWESFKKDGKEDGACPVKLTYPLILIQAVATSIDALAVGVSLSLANASIFTAAPIIGLTTAVLCLLALHAGKRLGERFGRYAEIGGGVLLILLAVLAVM